MGGWVSSVTAQLSRGTATFFLDLTLTFLLLPSKVCPRYTGFFKIRFTVV